MLPQKAGTKRPREEFKRKWENPKSSTPVVKKGERREKKKSNK